MKKIIVAEVVTGQTLRFCCKVEIRGKTFDKLQKGKGKNDSPTRIN